MSTITFSPVTSIMENYSATTVVTGQPGSGKTFFVLNLIANAILCNQRVIALDPKNDLSRIMNINNNFVNVDINKIKPGALNPFTFLQTVDTTIIMSVISSICGDLDDDKIVAISPIVQDFVTKMRKRAEISNERITFSSLANYLYASDNVAAQSVGTLLKINEDSKYGPLIFGESQEDFDLSTASQIITLFGLPLEYNSSGKKSPEEKFASTIVYLICKKLLDVLTSDHEIPTLFVVDEAHIVFSNPSILSIIDKFMALGRSLNVASVLASQNITHFPSGISQMIANKFMFKSAKDEASKFLEMFDTSDAGLSFNREYIETRIPNLEMGDCFFIDKKNRGGFMHVKSNLGDSISSNPLLKKRSQEA